MRVGGRPGADDAGASAADATGPWDAASFAAALLDEFRHALRRHKRADAEHRYQVVASYCRRTLGIVRSALDDGDDVLATSALGNFLVLHDATVEMRRIAPRLVPDTVLARRQDRALLLEDHIVQVLDRSTRPLGMEDLSRRLVDGGRTVDGEARLLAPHVERLVESGHLRRDAHGRIARTGRRHHGVEQGRVALDALVGPRLRHLLHEEGIRTVSDVVIDPARVARALGDVFAQQATLDAFVGVARRLAAELAVTSRETWPPEELRAYQRDAFDALRREEYAGLVLHAPAGSGKTLVGALCIVDWLEHLAPGQSVLVVVPTMNIQRQWVRELCFTDIGPRLPPHLVTTGTVRSLLAGTTRTRLTPAVTVVTYAALSEAASNDGSFHPGRVERLLQALAVQYVLLDEVHVAADDLRSLTAGVVGLFGQWRSSGMLRGVVGLSATAQPFASRFADLGLRIAFEVGELELVARGYVAPFAEAGVTFGYSEREQGLRRLASSYRAAMSEWFDAIGHERLRDWFAAIPMATRVAIARRLLRLTSNAPDPDAGLAERLARWERGGHVRAGDALLVTIVQAATGQSDRDLATRAARESGDPSVESRAASATRTLGRLRRDAIPLCSHDRSRRRLRARGFATTLDGHRLAQLLEDDVVTPTERRSSARDVLATTVVGTLSTLRDEMQDLGEGRVHTIGAIVDAERAARPVTGVVVFEQGGALHVDRGEAVPGHRGVAGTFAAFLDRDDVSVMAVLASELYLPARAPSTARAIAQYVRHDVVAREHVRSLVELATAGLPLPEAHRGSLAERATAGVDDLLGAPPSGGRVRAADLDAGVLRPLRRLVRSWSVGPDLEPVDRAAVAERLSRRNPHLRSWLSSVGEHLRLAEVFERSRTVRVRTAAGRRCAVEVVRLPAGHRRHLAFDLVARLVDRGSAVAGEAGATGDVLPPLDVVIVSSWARAGWNVVRPNVLIDATATRDRVAWQQLRGRALRPWPSWTPDRQRDLEAIARHGEARLDDAADVLVAHNKVAHVYELLKGYGNDPQVHVDSRGRLRRTPRLAAKHRQEHAVDLRTGEHGSGEGHAGIVVSVSPKLDTSVQLRAALDGVLVDADRRVVRGWLRAALSD